MELVSLARNVNTEAPDWSKAAYQLPLPQPLQRAAGSCLGVLPLWSLCLCVLCVEEASPHAPVLFDASYALSEPLAVLDIQGLG